DNVIRDLKVLVSNVNDRSCEPYNANDVTDILEQNEPFRAEIEKVKQHYKEMFESIKITRTSTNEKTSSLLTHIEDLKAQLKSKVSCVTSDSVKPKFLAPDMYAIDVKPIPHPLKNNRSAHLTYINHLKESVETVREIVEEDRVVKPLDNVIPSTGVNSSTRANGSKPRSNSKHNRILPAKSVNNKKVEDHPRTNKSVWTKVILALALSMFSVNATPTVKIILNKGKQIWKPKGKLSDNSLNKTKQIWQPKGKLFDNSLKKTKQVWKATRKLFANVGYQWRPTGKKFSLGELCPLTRLPVTCGTDHPLVSGLRLFKTRFRGMNGSCLAPQCLKMLDHSSSSLGLHSPFLKEKKGVRFSALLSSKEEKSFVLGSFTSTKFQYFVHARSVLWDHVDQLLF
ncbi:hypothetical protein Tco_1262826, partial [Tanacetum coccineum]